MVLASLVVNVVHVTGAEKPRDGEPVLTGPAAARKQESSTHVT